jgi:hypothetical protein
MFYMSLCSTQILLTGFGSIDSTSYHMLKCLVVILRVVVSINFYDTALPLLDLQEVICYSSNIFYAEHYLLNTIATLSSVTLVCYLVDILKSEHAKQRKLNGINDVYSKFVTILRTNVILLKNLTFNPNHRAIYVYILYIFLHFGFHVVTLGTPVIMCLICTIFITLLK